MRLEWNFPTEFPEYRYTMGFKINDVPIPDPAVFTGAESDLDTMGERDATGYLHRNMVATKHPLKLEYHNIEWRMILEICGMLRHDKFQFTFPSPFDFGDNGYDGAKTIDAYVGDRDFEAVWCSPFHTWLGNLKFSVIEY